jgi:predicted GH43/DUF377 family glycosyl hydrolase
MVCRKETGVDVPQRVMEQVYQESRTPHKFGIVLRAEAEQEVVDCPSVFRHGGRWYMMYVALVREKIGYQTYLAASDDLLRWTKLGVILPFRRDGWDAWQADGGIALQTCTWGGSYELGTHGGRYWASYIGGAKQGYEPDPLSIGLAWTDDPTAAREWTRLESNPVIGPGQADVRDFEARTAYKSNIIRDASRATGHEFVMFYNGKAPKGIERIGMAVSDDMVHWRRHGDGPVVDNGRGISGDPQIVRMGGDPKCGISRLGTPEVWVMFYFGAFWKPKSDTETQRNREENDKDKSDTEAQRRREGDDQGKSDTETQRRREDQKPEPETASSLNLCASVSNSSPSSQCLCASVSSSPLRDDTKAFDTFACSYDLVNWTKWPGPHLIEPSEPWDATFAHKPWIVKHADVVYHFYCAVGSEGRHIALATSKDLR